MVPQAHQLADVVAFMNGYILATLDIEAAPPTVTDVTVVLTERGYTLPPGIAILGHLQGFDAQALCLGLAGLLAGESLAWTYKYEGVVTHLRDWLKTPELPSSDEHS